MKHTLAAIAVLYALQIVACKQKCTIQCPCLPSIHATGYTSAELDTVVVKTFTPDGSFSNEKESFIISATKEVWWHHVNDTTKTTFIFGTWYPYFSGYNLLNYLGYSNGKYDDFEITVPSYNRVYKISNLIISGPATEEINCKGGSISHNQSCSNYQYIGSYIIDGNLQTFPPNTNRMHIYINK